MARNPLKIGIGESDWMRSLRIYWNLREQITTSDKVEAVGTKLQHVLTGDIGSSVFSGIVREIVVLVLLERSSIEKSVNEISQNRKERSLLQRKESANIMGSTWSKESGPAT